jgi:hypothetical protein
VPDYIRYITIKELEEIFKNFKIGFAEIFECILEGKLNIYLDKLNICKTTNIYVCKEEAFLLFLEIALEKIKRDVPQN